MADPKRPSNPEPVDFAFLHKYDETQIQKLKRKVRENPLVPIGMGATVAALVLGIVNFKRGNQRNQQIMMRARVFAQGGTVLALVAGLYMAAVRDKKNQ